MPGIFLGNTPLNMGAPVKEIYAGAIKVWPVSTLYYGSRWLTGDGAAMYAASNFNVMSATTPAGTGWGSFEWGCTLPPGAGGQSGIAFSYVSTWAIRAVFIKPLDRPSVGSYSLYVNNETTPRQATMFIRAFTDAADQFPQGRDAYLRVGVDGNVLWASEPGFSCVRSAQGIYNITCPGPLQNLPIYVTPSRTALNSTASSTAHSIDQAAGTFTVSGRTGTTLVNTNSFSVWMVLANV